MPFSSAVTETCLPSLNTGLPSIINLTSANASAVPFSVGKLSFVKPNFTSPFTAPPATSSIISVITGLAQLVSTLMVATFDGLLTLPALSVAVAVTLYSPSASGVFGVNSQAPLALTSISSPIISFPFLRTIVEPASAVPLNLGVLSFVKPLSLPRTLSNSTPPYHSSITAVITGVLGAVKSELMLSFTISLALPA